jgi:uncharacterized Ntn-hydrolase superfamily protein
MRAVKTSLSLLATAVCTACLPAVARTPGDGELLTKLDMNTWSVAAIDPKTGDVGVASASCVTRLADALAALVPGKGAGATQASFDLKNRNVVYEGLKAGLTAEEIIARVISPANDTMINSRQYGVVTYNNGIVHVAGFTTPTRLGQLPDPQGGTSRWAGVMTDTSMGVTVQGNTLASKEVVGKALEAFQWNDPAGFNTLTDRLMRAVEAGSIYGGDVRCNNAAQGRRQTASMAFIVAARGTDQPYAAEMIGMSDQGTPKAPWLAISLTTPSGMDNPLLELRKRYDEWRRSHIPAPGR